MSWLSERVMFGSECKKVIRMDHSQKITKKLKVFNEKGKKKSSPEAKMLLTIQNEIGQIMARSVTRSENNAQSKVILEKLILPRITDKDDKEDKLYVIGDNANNIRNMISDISGDACAVKQDVWHVIHRFTEKFRDQVAMKRLSKKLREAIFKIDGQLRNPKEMELKVRAVLHNVSMSELKCSEEEWKGCIESNMTQIQRGDLFVDDNEFWEKGNMRKIVSTSQVESFHSKLKKLLGRYVSYEIGWRVLDFEIIKVCLCGSC